MKGLIEPLAVASFALTNFFYLYILLMILCLQLPFILLKRLLQKQPSRKQVRGPALKMQMKIVEAKLADGTVNRAPRDTVLLLHGFPDSGNLWDGTVERLTHEGYRCLVVSTPGSMGEKVPQSIPLDAIVEDLNELLGDEYKSVTVLAHDWGCAFVLLMIQKYPERFRRLVFLDVGEMKKVHWLVLLAVISYQLCFVVTYHIGHPFGTLFLKWFTWRFGYNARPLRELYSDMTWLYASLLNALVWKNDGFDYSRKLDGRSSGDDNSRTTTTSAATNGWYAKVSRIPKMFLYGAKKPFYFHEDEFLDVVRKSPHGFVKALNCGHWIPNEADEQYLTFLTQWLDKSDLAEHNISNECD